MTSSLAGVIQRNHHSIVQVLHPDPITAPELVENLRRSVLISKHECYEFAHEFTLEIIFDLAAEWLLIVYLQGECETYWL